MAWVDLASNQMVSYTDAQTSGFTLKSGQSQVTSNQCMTKLDITTKYNVTIAGYSDSQLIPKSAWGASVSFSVTPALNASGTVTISGAPASFYAYLNVLQYSGGTFNCSITINGITRSVSATSTGVFTSSSFSLNPGTYNFSITSNPGIAPSGYGASIQYTQ